MAHLLQCAVPSDDVKSDHVTSESRNNTVLKFKFKSNETHACFIQHTRGFCCYSRTWSNHRQHMVDRVRKLEQFEQLCLFLTCAVVTLHFSIKAALVSIFFKQWLE